MRATMMRERLAAIGAIASMLGMCGAALAQTTTFNCTLQQAQSSATYNIAISAPFQTGTDPLTGLPFSYLIGNWDAVTNPTGTRTIPGLFGGNLAANTPVTFSSGSLTASGQSGTTPLRPTGSFALTLNLTNNTASVNTLAVNLLPTGTITLAANVGFQFSSFRTRQPTCTVLGIPLTLPVGDIIVTQLTATQSAGTAGTLTPTGPNTYAISVPVVMTVQGAANFNGSPTPIPPAEVPAVVEGTAVVSGSDVSVNATLNLTNQQTQPGPFPFAPLPFVEPLCQGNLLVNVTAASVTSNVTTNAAIVAAGSVPPVGCDSTDFNGDGDFPTPLDLEDFINANAGNFCPTCSSDLDFNNDGDFPTPLDVESFISVLGGGPCL